LASRSQPAETVCISQTLCAGGSGCAAALQPPVIALYDLWQALPAGLKEQLPSSYRVLNLLSFSMESFILLCSFQKAVPMRVTGWMQTVLIDTP
jgi:hypothetical protein